MSKEAYLAVIIYAPLWSMDVLHDAIISIRNLSHIPIIVLTKRKPALSVLKFGADMCYQPDGDIEWLCDHIMAYIRRYTHYDRFEHMSYTTSIIQRGELLIDPPHYRVLLSGAEIELQPREFRLLTYFARNPSIVLSVEQICDAVWSSERHHKRDVTVMISTLRRKLRDDKQCPTYIETIRGVGYRFIPNK